MENTIESTTIDPNTGETINHYHVTDNELAEGIQEAIEEAVVRAEETIIRSQNPNPYPGMNPPPFFVNLEPMTNEADEVQEFVVEPEREVEFVEDRIWEEDNISRDTVRKVEASAKQVEVNMGVDELKKRSERIASKVVNGRTVNITGHDIIIQKDTDGIQVDHCMRTEPITVKELENINAHGYKINGVHDIFYFDKSFNHIIMDKRKLNNDQDHKILKGVYPRFKGEMVKEESLRSGNYRKKDAEQFVVIDKKKFMDSKGDKFVIKQKNGLSYKEILEIKSFMRKRLRHAERFTKRIGKIVGSIYDQENFDVLYGLVFEKTAPNTFYVFVKFPDVTIKNSIEIEHYLGDMFIRLEGYHEKRWNFRIEADLHGMRRTFTPLDRVLRWSHSHLAKSNDSQGFSSFCIGSDNHMFTGNYYDDNEDGYDNLKTTPLEFESILLSIEDFISWESLEGGPYNKIEDINFYSEKLVRYSSIDEYGCNDSYVRDNLFKKILTDENLKKLKTCFRLIKTDNHAKYVVDFNSFYTIILSIFEKDEINILCTKNRQSVSIYNPSKNEFYLSSLKGLGSWETVKDAARKLLPSKRIIYMNGKYHKPTLIKMNEIPSDLKGNLTSVNPIFLTRIANVILHQLTTKLIKNEQ